MPDVPRIAFLGTPEFAAVHLRALIDAGYPPVLVVTQPDRQAGRTLQIKASDVKVVASRAGIELAQPERVRKREFIDWFAAQHIALTVVVAYGQILAPRFLEVPPRGSWNVHASLLPRWRGSAPIHRAIIAGDTLTGCSIQRVVPELDAGPVVAERELPIAPEETAGSLHDKLAILGAELLVETLPRLLDGNYSLTPQPSEGITFAPPLSKTDGLIDWAASPQTIANRVRGVCPWPGAWVIAAPLVRSGQTRRIRRFRICRVTTPETCPLPEAPDDLPGVILAIGPEALYVRTGERGVVAIHTVQPEGKGPMPVEEFLRGYPMTPGSMLQ